MTKNAELVNEDCRFHADLWVKNGRVETIAGDLDARSGEQAIDAGIQTLADGRIRQRPVRVGRFDHRRQRARTAADVRSLNAGRLL